MGREKNWEGERLRAGKKDLSRVWFQTGAPHSVDESHKHSTGEKRKQKRADECSLSAAFRNLTCGEITEVVNRCIYCCQNACNSVLKICMLYCV